MATLVLSAAGAAVGALFGPIGVIAGRAIGALAGYAVDQAVFGNRRTVEGARLADLNVQGSTEGSPIPRIYGRVRIAGEIIWATRFEEVVSESREGGKGGLGGNTTRTYSYFANFAIGLCEGPIARIGRVWADGKPFDLSAVTHRLYLGDREQTADSLIEAKQGEAPAYRDTAVMVIERLPLEDFGNRIPQLSFEVMRPVVGIEQQIRAVTLIPGSTEFGYDPELVAEVVGPGSRRAVNRHVDGAATDWQAALDDLQATVPSVGRVGLVATWFGDDLRVGECTLKPGVTDRTTETNRPWGAAGLIRDDARLVSTYAGKPAFGGTPSDASIIAALRDLADRGLAVTFYPFVMMDIPAGNALPDPYGAVEQGAYPWRGSLTLSVAPGEPGSPDKTAAAASEVAAFVGTVAPGDFGLDGDEVVYSGPDEWSYRRMVLHNAHLCKAAGGVDAFLIGSELPGLTTIRSGASTYPFVAALVSLAHDVRTVLGPGTKISYAADWSEYFGHCPSDGSGDVFFHLDPLWSDGDIDFVGIDNYFPLSDWRDGAGHLDAAIATSGRDAAYLRSNVAAGEYYDWHYASPADRDAQARTPITDGAYGKPWVFRPKDILAWWSNQHFDRPAGVEGVTPTAWVPQGKPIWFTECGCPAVDKGANQPNVFPDPKSSASALPWYSSGVRDDLVQRRYIGAMLGHWDQDDPLFDGSANPVSSEYAGRMVQRDGLTFWTWDARPYPQFPLLTDVWSDGANWETGHWLTGRLGSLSADALVRQVVADYGVSPVSVDDLDGTVDGYAIDRVMSARAALEPLAQLLFFEGFESGDTFRIVPRARPVSAALDADDLVEQSADNPLVSIKRGQETELPVEVGIGFADALADYRPAAVTSRRLVGSSRRLELSGSAVVMTSATATGIADTLLQDVWAGRETISLALPQRALGVEPADIVTVEVDGQPRMLMVNRVEDAGFRRIEARSIEPDILSPGVAAPRVLAPRSVALASAPDVTILDLPVLGAAPAFAPRIAVFADPWPGAIAIAIGDPDSGFAPRQAIARRATIGELIAPLDPGPLWRFDHATTIDVRLYGGTLSGEAELAVLNGANLAAVGRPGSGFEVIQFEAAELIGPRTYRLSGLLRGQGGTADVMAGGHDAGARFVLLDGAVEPLALVEAESAIALTVRCGAAGAVYDPDTFTDLGFTPTRRGLRCLPPVRLRAGRDTGSGDVTLTWTRQTRVGGDPWEPVEVPLGEAAEAYRVAIYDGTDVVRSIDVTSPSALYAAADQTADFGSPPSAIAVAISQVSPTDGLGIPAMDTLHV